MTEWDAKSIFARNICDPNLERFKEELLEHKTDRTLEEMIVKLRIHDEELARTAFDSNRGGPKRVRRTPDGPNKRQRTGSSGTGTLTGTIHPNLKGIIRIPPETWHELSQLYRDWVLKYNQAIRHSDTPPPTPEGVTVGPPQDDGLNHFIPKSGRQRRVRRVMAPTTITPTIESPPTPLSPPTESPPPDTDSDHDSIGTIDETELFPPGTTALKTVRFHLHSGGDDGEVTQNAANSTPRRNASSYFYTTRRNKLELKPDETEVEDSENKDEDSDGEDVPDLVARTTPDLDDENEINNNDTKREQRDLQKVTRKIYQERRPRRTTRNSAITNIHRYREVQQNDNIAVIDSGGGRRPTVTEQAWLRIGGETGMTSAMRPYMSNDTNAYVEHPVCSAVTKAFIPGREDPVLLMVHYATFVTKDKDQTDGESLLTTIDMGDHGVLQMWDYNRNDISTIFI
eukprot:jgi/Psemu1/49840/gm1.49840_g